MQNYFEQTGRRLTFEYSLVGGVNDTPEDARELCRTGKAAQLSCESDSGKPDQGTGLCTVGGPRQFRHLKEKLERSGIQC